MISVFIQGSNGLIWKIDPDGALIPSSLGMDTGNQGWGFSGATMIPANTPSIGHWGTDPDGALIPK